MEKKMDLLNDETRKLFLHYLLPSISATLVTSIYILADTIMIGKGVGALGIAALNIVLPIFNIFFGTGVLFGIGGAILMSMNFGKGDIAEGQRYFTTSVISAAVMAVVFWIVIGGNLERILYGLGATSQTYGMSYEYGQLLIIFTPAFMFSSLLQVYVRNDKDPVTAMIAVIAGGVTNVVLDYVFIFLLDMGIRGGIRSTVMGTCLTVGILCTHFFRKNNHLKLRRDGFAFFRLKTIAKNGFASFLLEVSGGVVVMVFNLQLVKYVGDVGIVVYGIISNSSIVAMSLANGVAQAAQPIMATNFGAGKMKRVRETMHMGLRTAIAVGVVFCILGIACPRMITDLFVTATEEIYTLAIPAVRIYFPSFVGMTANIFISIYYQSTMRAGRSLVIGVMRGLVLSMVLVMILPQFFGMNGIWMVMPCVEALTILLILVWKKLAKEKELPVFAER